MIKIMEYEFSVPEEKLDQTSDILWAMERTKNAYRGLIDKTGDLVKSQFIEMFEASDQAFTECPIIDMRMQHRAPIAPSKEIRQFI